MYELESLEYFNESFFTQFKREKKKAFNFQPNLKFF